MAFFGALVLLDTQRHTVRPWEDDLAPSIQGHSESATLIQLLGRIYQSNERVSLGPSPQAAAELSRYTKMSRCRLPSHQKSCASIGCARKTEIR
jgi:hypothetical protein